MLDPRAGEPGAEVGASVRRRRRARRVLIAAILVLYALSIPWYRATGEPVALILGLPDWVAVAIGCYVGVAFLNAAAWLLADVPDGVPRDEGGGQ